MSATYQLILWFIAPAPIILLWALVTNKDASIGDKIKTILLGELFGVVSAVFIIAFWIDMLIEKITQKWQNLKNGRTHGTR